MRLNNEERLKSKIKVNEETGCWEWQAYKDKGGYGHFLVNGYYTRAHRASYIIFNGDFDRSLDVCHKCDNPPCVNPDHLFLGTHKDNMHDAINKGRLPYTPHPSLATYIRGCRCEDCKEAWVEYSKKNRDRINNNQRARRAAIK